MESKASWEQYYDEHFGAITDTGNYDAEVKAFIRQTRVDAVRNAFEAINMLLLATASDETRRFDEVLESKKQDYLKKMSV